VTSNYIYDGDGQRVKATFGSSTTVYIGNYYEQAGSTIRKYPSASLRAGYYANGRRVAMRENSTVYYLLTDHPSLTLRTGLGSTAITTDSSGSRVAELRYKAWGETRYTWGTTPTTYRFTGQREDATIGLYPSLRSGQAFTTPATTTPCWGGSSARTASCRSRGTRRR